MINFIPIGGLGEIGANFFIIEKDGFSILIDCGIAFCNDNIGVDFIIPNYREIIKKYKIDCIFVTHGHEDHIGGIPFFLKEKNIPIYSTPFSLKLIKRKCDRRLVKSVNLKNIKYYEDIKKGPFSIKYIPAGHSIPDTSVLYIKTKEAKIMFLSDFKMAEGFLKDLKEFSKVDLLFSDSTNVGSKNSLSEEEVFKNLDYFFKEAKKKIILTLFSSNIYRVSQILKLAKKHRKKVFISGTNIDINLKLAKELRYVKNLDVLREKDDYSKFPDSEKVIICTGSQGEHLSSMDKVSMGYHPYLKIEEDDMIIFSSSKIPGNERPIYNLMNKLAEKGAIIIDDLDGVHNSGHADSKALKKVIEVLKPKCFVPIHGENLHLKKHIKLSEVKNSIFLRNGDILSFDKGKANITDREFFDRIYFDTITGDFIDKNLVEERKILSRGVLVALININKQGVLKRPVLKSIGISKNPEFFKNLKKMEERLEKYIKGKKINDEMISNFVKQEFRRFYRDKPFVFSLINNV